MTTHPARSGSRPVLSTASVLAIGAAALVGGGATSGAQTNPTPIIFQGFDLPEAVPMEDGPGGWEISGGRYGTHDPVRSGAGAIGNSNLTVHAGTVGRDVTIDAVLEAERTAGAWDDFSLVFGYQDPDNYLYAGFNETNDATGSGIFAVVDGVGTELADIDAGIVGGSSFAVRVVRDGDTIEVWGGLDGNPPTSPLATATTDLFPEGKVGFGSRNNAVFANHLQVTDGRSSRPVAQFSDQGFGLGSEGVVDLAGGWAFDGDESAELTDPITSGAGSIGNSNLAVRRVGSLYADRQQDFRFIVEDVSAAATASAWDDVSIVFGHRDEDNYLYVSLNESNDATTSGIFAVVDGVGTELADIDVAIEAGASHEVRVDRWGSDIWIYLDDRLIAEAETDLLTEGRWGFGTRNGAATFGAHSVDVWAAGPALDTP
ncbi:MAG: hypothetical protein S0880_14605 [Actinomycetota bacterium]|nr:hypothetical protein [Actinomycetota bacterium]